MACFVNRNTLEVIKSAPADAYDDVTDEATGWPLMINVGSEDALPSIPKRYWKAFEDSIGVKSEEEQADADALLLATAKASTIRSAETLFEWAFDQIYPERRQRTLAWMVSAANRKGLVNREAYINQLDDWLMDGLQHLAITINGIKLETSVGAVLETDTSWVEAWLATDPKVSIFAAMEIAN